MSSLGRIQVYKKLTFEEFAIQNVSREVPTTMKIVENAASEAATCPICIEVVPGSMVLHRPCATLFCIGCISSAFEAGHITCAVLLGPLKSGSKTNFCKISLTVALLIDLVDYRR